MQEQNTWSIYLNENTIYNSILNMAFARKKRNSFQHRYLSYGFPTKTTYWQKFTNYSNLDEILPILKGRQITKSKHNVNVNS